MYSERWHDEYWLVTLAIAVRKTPIARFVFAAMPNATWEAPHAHAITHRAGASGYDAHARTLAQHRKLAGKRASSKAPESESESECARYGWCLRPSCMNGCMKRGPNVCAVIQCLMCVLKFEFNNISVFCSNKPSFYAFDNWYLFKKTKYWCSDFAYFTSTHASTSASARSLARTREQRVRSSTLRFKWAWSTHHRNLTNSCRNFHIIAPSRKTIENAAAYTGCYVLSHMHIDTYHNTWEFTRISLWQRTHLHWRQIYLFDTTES